MNIWIASNGMQVDVTTDQGKALAYYLAAHLQNAQCDDVPPYVPSWVRLPHGARGDAGYESTVCRDGDQKCHCNRWGAVSVLASDGSLLGLRLNEFEPLRWKENTGSSGRPVTPWIPSGCGG